MKTILSLFDYTGTWSAPYKQAGYNVIQVDIKRGVDVFEVLQDAIFQHVDYGSTVHGILAAPPCTDFAGSGARWWNDKEKQPAKYDGICPFEWDNTVDLSVGLVLATLFIIELLKPSFYAIENPVGRITRLVPELGQPWYFNPCDFGDPYTKKTAIYGHFNKPDHTPVLSLFGSEMWAKYGGKSDRTKAMRSVTPKGFAAAFFNANR